jgi:hypothetical protein
MARKEPESADDRKGQVDRTTASAPRRPAITEVRPPQVTTNDEAGDPSVMNAENPMLVREEVNNTSDSSGPHAGDEAKGKVLKEQLKRGLREIEPMD